MISIERTAELQKELAELSDLRAENKRLREALRCTETALEEELKQIRRELAE